MSRTYTIAVHVNLDPISRIPPRDRNPVGQLHRTGSLKQNVTCLQYCASSTLSPIRLCEQPTTIRYLLKRHNSQTPTEATHKTFGTSMRLVVSQPQAFYGRPSKLSVCPVFFRAFGGGSGGLPRPVMPSEGMGAVTAVLTSRSKLSNSSVNRTYEAGEPSNWSDITLANFMARATQFTYNLSLWRSTVPRPTESP